MVSQRAMATTVRKVKQEDRLRRQNLNQDEESSKAILLSKLVANNLWNQKGPDIQKNGRQTIIEANSQVTSGQVRITGDETYVQNCGQTFAPEYKMPPLYGEEQSSNKTQQVNNLQTHSNQFPTERESSGSGTERNSKIPIIHEYKQRSAGRTAIAPDAPIKQQAWIQEDNLTKERDIHPKSYPPHETYSAGGVSTKVSSKGDEEKTKTLTRTYHTIKDMISSRFGPSRKEIESESDVNLSNGNDEMRKSIKTVDDDDCKKKDTPIRRNQEMNVQQYHKNSYGQYVANYNYQQNSQPNVVLPGQMQSMNEIQPSLPGQSAQLHVTHHTPPGGVQMVHQTQLSGFAQAPPMNQPVQNTRDYVIQGPTGLSNQHQNMHHLNSQSQNSPSMKHVMQMQQQSALQNQMSNASYQSPQQIMHQNQMHQQSRFAQQHAQNMHQRHLLQQMHQQHQQSNVRPHFNNNYQQYPARQSMSRSQVDLPSTSRQNKDGRVPGQEVYYHYAQNQSRLSRYDAPQVYMKPDQMNQENEFQRQNSGRSIEKAASQPHLSFDNEGVQENDACSPRLNSESQNVGTTMANDDKERYEITVDDHQLEFDRKGSHRKEDFRPETSFGLRQEELRSSKKDRSLVHESDNSVQAKIKEFQERSEQETSKVTKDSQEFENRVNGQVKKCEDKTDNVNTSYKDENSRKDLSCRKNDLEHGIDRLKIQHLGSGSEYDKAGQSSSNVDSGRGSAVYSSGRRALPEEAGLQQGQDSEWVDIVESELRNILEPRDASAMAHSTLSESVSSVTPPLPPLSPHESPRNSRNRYSSSLPYGSKPNYSEYCKNLDKRNYQSAAKHRGASTSKKDSAKKFSHLIGIEAGDVTSTTGLDLDSMLDRSDSDLSTNDARTIRKQLEGLESMYSEVLKLLGGSMKKRRKTRGLTSYGSVSSLPTSSVSSRPVARHHDKRRSHVMDDRMKKAKDMKSINKRFQRLESHVVTLARSVAHLSSEMRTQHLMIQEMENIRGEIATLRTQTSMAIVRSQSQPLLKDAELPALSNPSRVKKLTKFFGTEPPLIRLFLRELGYEKYAGPFEKEKVGMVELPYLSEERLQKMGIPLGPRLRILQEARISVCKDAVYVV